MPSADVLRGFAPHDAVPHFRSTQALGAMSLGPEEGFVLSRVDGKTRLSELLNLVPFDPQLTVAILKRLWIAGAIEIPGHAPPAPENVTGKATAPATAPRTVTGQVPIIAPPVAQMPALPSEVPADVDLSLEQVQQIEAAFAGLSEKNAFELLGVARSADKREVKRAYFKLSKDFHPDRFFGKRLGIYKDRLNQIFQAVKSAFELLSDDARREAYLDSIKD